MPGNVHVDIYERTEFPFSHIAFKILDYYMLQNIMQIAINAMPLFTDIHTYVNNAMKTS